MNYLIKMVVYNQSVITYLSELIEILYIKEYFGFRVSAKKYVDKLRDFIETSIHTRPKKQTPLSLRKYGSHYVSYRPNKTTTWYIFIFYSKDRYFINHITNNHSTARYIKGLK